ncbi:hypothetical protein [Caenispirillum bisanense]|uniref:Uncharacterized protein n=1 Tax=Caenispirillum bisanense TaxID=414052 RepID=A0A286GQC2_9PROT|nr:hypothetical protein [Caenispirillum bisanense]SOD97708.1 hypothetical protein SAMN05421508_10756 [Caenispirillum bisanense]
MEAGRLGQHLWFRDCDDIRHLVRIASIQMVCDADPAQDETVLFVANKQLRVPIPLDALMPMIDPAGRQKQSR